MSTASSSNCRNIMLSATPKNSFYLKELNEKKDERNKQTFYNYRSATAHMMNAQLPFFHLWNFVVCFKGSTNRTHFRSLCVRVCMCWILSKRNFHFVPEMPEFCSTFGITHANNMLNCTWTLILCSFCCVNIIWQCALKIVITQRALHALVLCPVVAAMDTRPNEKFIVHSPDLHGVRDASAQFVLPINKIQINVISGSIIEAIGSDSMLFSLQSASFLVHSEFGKYWVFLCCRYTSVCCVSGMYTHRDWHSRAEAAIKEQNKMSQKKSV